MKLIGKLGEIVVGEKECTAYMKPGILERKYGSTQTFPSEELQNWIKKLKIYSTQDGSIKFGEWK